MNTLPTTDVLLVTVTDIETAAVRDVLAERYGRSFELVFHSNQTYRDLGVIGGARVLLVRSEMGTSGIGSSQMTVTQAITALSPRAVIMVGIAFGLDPQRQQIGDVLVARQLMSYELQRIGTSSDGAQVILPRGDRTTASPLLLDRFRAAEETWQQAKVRFGLVLSGEKLVDNAAYRTELGGLESEAIGGEMEGSGLYTAAQTNRVDWMLVKAICDWADGHKHVGKDENQRLAAHNAAAFVLHMLAQGGMAAPQPVAVAVGAPSQSLHPSLPKSVPAPAVDRNQLRRILVDGMGLDDLRDMCYDLSIDPENLGGSNKSALVRELIQHLERRSSLGKLVDWLREQRPDLLG